MSPRFGFIPLASIMHNEGALNRLIADYVPAFERIGGERWQSEQVERPAPLFLFVVTGGTERNILLWQETMLRPGT